MKHTYSINFNNLSERAKESIEYYLLLNERKNGESSLKDDLERDLEIANTQKPSQDKERAAWIDRLTGQIVLEDNEEEEGRKIVQKIIKTYSQDHTYIIPNLIGCGCVGDNIEGPFLFDAQPEMVASKKRYYMYESKLMFEHTVKGISITPMIPVN